MMLSTLWGRLSQLFDAATTALALSYPFKIRLVSMQKACFGKKTQINIIW